MYTIGICDDEKITCGRIEDILLEISKELRIKFEIEVWYSGEDLCNYLKQGYKLDIIILDIDLLEGNGVEIGNFVRDELNDFYTAIVYISHEKNYAMQLFKIQPLDFLIKPIKKEDILNVINRYIRQNNMKNMQFEFQKGHSRCKVLYNEIIYFQSSNRKIVIVTMKGKEEFYGKLKEITEAIPPMFLQIHKSYVINQNYVCKYRYESVKMQNGEELSISKPYRSAVKKQLSLKVGEWV